MRKTAIVVNAITGLRLLLAAAVAVLTLWSGDRTWAVAASVLLVVGIEVSDLLDGHLARSRGAVTQFGKMFDPYADSVSRLTVFWSLAVVGRALAVLPLVMAVRDVTVSYARIIMARTGRDVSARYTGKLKAVVQGAGGVVLMAAPLYWAGWSAGARRGLVWGVSVGVMVVTLTSMFDYARAALRGS